jgi:tight adherence protein C
MPNFLVSPLTLFPIALLFFAAFLMLSLTLTTAVVERRRVYRALRAIRAIEVAPHDLRRKELAAPFHIRLLLPGLKRLARLGRRLTGAATLDRLQRQVVYAGSPAGWDAERVLAYKILLAIVLGLGGLALTLLLRVGFLRVAILTALLAVGGYYLPDLILYNQASKRQELIAAALPDTIDLLAMMVQAGMGFDGAMARAGKEMRGPLGEEFHRVVQETQLGKARSEALKDLAERSTVPELKSFVLALTQAEVYGIPIATVLHVQAKEMRLKRRQRAEERAQKIPVKLVFPLIFCIMPSLFIVLLGPAAIRIYRALFGVVFR